jgi:outer membrane protein
VALAVAAPAAQAAPAAPRAITLQDALGMAARMSPAMIQAQGQSRLANAEVRSSWGAFIPTLSVSSNLTRQYPTGARTREVDGTVVILSPEPWSFGASFSSNVTLFDGGARYFELKQARARASAANVDLAAQEFSTALVVKQDYFAVLAAREAREAALSQVSQGEQALKAATARLRSGTVTRSDSLRADIQLRSAKIALLDADNAIRNAEASLTRVTGASEPVTAAETEPPAPGDLLVPEDELRVLAETGPLVQEAEESLEAARAAKSATWSTYLPTVNLGYSRGGNGSREDFGVGFDDLTYSGSLRFSLSLPIFNQFNREQQVTSASVALANAEAAYRDARLAASESFTSAYGALLSADERAQSMAASVAAAEEDLRVQQRRYELGGSTLLDVLASQGQLDNARLDLIRARYDQRIARAQLESLVGRNLEGVAQ